MPRLWPAIDVQIASTPDADAEELQGLVLAALDDSSVTAVQALSSTWRVFFTSDGGRDAALEVLRRLWPDATLAPVDVADEDWARRSQENLGPIRVERLRISPPWATATSEPLPAPAIDITIKPSMGFGTGHHASTRLCIRLLLQIDPVGRRVLDVGTGSGVLAIVASRLGAEAVLGIDDDADALESARENLQLNGVTSGIELRRADFRSLPPLQFDVVTANLTGALLVRGAASLVATLASRGTLVLSGITLEEEPAVREAFDAALSCASRLEEDGWVGLLYERKNEG